MFPGVPVQVPKYPVRTSYVAFWALGERVRIRYMSLMPGLVLEVQEPRRSEKIAVPVMAMRAVGRSLKRIGGMGIMVSCWSIGT